MNQVVVYPGNGPLSQGTIFSCAVAEDYSACTTHGLVITARCDVAIDKVRKYNYVPVVHLNDWLHRDGRIILASRLMAQTLGGLRKALIDGGFSPSILETESPRSVLSVLFCGGEAHATPAKLRQRFSDLCDRYELATRGILSEPSDTVCLHVAKTAPGLRDGLLAELVTQRLAGYCFLDRVEPDGDDSGYVALLREIQAIPRLAAHAVANGLDAGLLADMCKAEPSLPGRLRVPRDGLAMPVGRLSSPNLEHLMQSFSLLFSRIGIPDPDESYLAGLWARQPSVKEDF
jgi:hypothetical protein